MIIELDILDHTILFEEQKNILMLIIDPADIWKVEEKKGLKGLFKGNAENDMMRKHFIYLCKKIENYINYINNNGLINNFPEILDDILNKFNCLINDTYDEINENDSEKSYIEIASDSIGNIKKLLSIIGKHIYIKEEGKYANLIIE